MPTYGVFVDNENDPAQVVIRGNRIDGYDAAGIAAVAYGTVVSIIDNAIGGGKPNKDGHAGIRLGNNAYGDQGATGTISGNTTTRRPASSRASGRRTRSSTATTPAATAASTARTAVPAPAPRRRSSGRRTGGI